ncbi:MAG: PEP-utilizing enzyme [Sandaracinaceae bacterium]
MANVVPVDEFIKDEWYPGFKPEYGHTPWATEPVKAFSKEDEKRFWFLDFHWPNGMTPMGIIFLEDGYGWGTQCAAQHLPLPPGKGIAQRLGGTHVYASEVPVTSEWELGFRGARIEKNLPPFLQSFDAIWSQRVWELDTGLKYFEGFTAQGKNLSDLVQNLVDARTFQRRAWEIHFEMMYPLLANYLGFYGVCGELNIDPGEISKFLQGYDTKILECDRELWKLTADAKATGIDDVFANHPAEDLMGALSRQSRASGWVSRFQAFLDVYGWRTEGISDIALPPWVEDPTSPLGTIKTFLQKGEIHDFEAARKAAIEERDTAIDAARGRLTKEEQAQFDGALSACQAANFAWWNDEHNYYIDLRATIPMRRACLALSDALGGDQPDDTLFLFWPEMRQIASGDKPFKDFKPILRERRAYYEHWRDRRPTMPKVLGTIPEAVTDPILIEIFGMHHHFFNAMKAAGQDVQTLTGVAASAGTVRGKARVLHSAGELHRILPGEVLVCEATSPNWTPAFAKIAACVCDGGGTLTHASIISREYRIPCVVGVGLATQLIDDGDEVEVDGSKGTVTVFKAKAA